MKFHGVEMKGNFVCLTVSNTGELGSAGIKGRLVHVESTNGIYIDTGTEWKRTGIDPYLLNADTIISADVDNVPLAISAGENTVFGRLTGGHIKDLSTTELTTLLEKATSADIAAGSSGVKFVTPLALSGFVKPFVRGGTIVNDIDYLRSINVPVWYATMACTVKNVRGYRVGGTGATINARKNGSLNHLASALSLTSANTWIDGGAVQNSSYVAGDKLEIMLVSVAGSASQIGIQVDFDKT
jgi:hypothetical protein